jgi:phospholipid/cholesterol/gamma-HCH transport system permease protein
MLCGAMDDRPGSGSTGQPKSTTASMGVRSWHARAVRGGVVVELTGDWTVSADNRGSGPVQQILDTAAAGRGIAFDSQHLGQWDSTLLVFLASLRRDAVARAIPFDDTGLPPAAARLLALSAEAVPIAKRASSTNPLLSRVGQAAIDTSGEAVEVMTLVGDTLLSGGRAVRGEVRMRSVDLMTCIHEAGAAALPIVTIVNVLIGGIVAFVGAVQLRRFGADVFVADLIGVAMIREMVSLMTAIIMSGRTGGAYAAHIATMLGNEEIDALGVIGIPVNDYLILPRLLALTGMMPLLYLYGCAVGIFGGFVVAVAMLNLTPRGFIDEIASAVAGGQIVFGLVKSVAFGALIAIVGCRAGLRAGRSAADVGRAATKAVVAGIVGVIALDAVFAICANALNF